MCSSDLFNIVNAVFDVSQSVIARSAGVIQGSTDVTPDMLDTLETTLEGMDLGPLVGLFMQTIFIGFTMKALSIIIFVLVYGRMLHIYLLTSLAPLPMAALANREIGGTGLGLSIVKHAAAYHDAKIQLDSQLGRGTRVRVLFPLSQREAQP